MASTGLSDDTRWRRSVAVDADQTLVVRLSTHTDYRDVVAIDKHHKIYEGHDYIPELYHQILHEEHTFCFVGVLNGTIVYFTVMHICDEGRRTSVSCAARISEACRGQKIAILTRNLVYEIIRENIPTVVRDHWTGVMWDNTLAASRKPNPPFKLLHTWNFLGVLFPGDQLQNFLTNLPQTSHSVKLLTRKQAADVISDADTCRRIFPLEQTLYIRHNWMPVSVPTTHVKRVLANTDFYGLFNNEAELVAVGTNYVFPSAYGIENQVVYYGKQDLDYVKAFCVAVMRDSVKHSASGRPLCYALSFPVEVDLDTFAEFFSGHEIPTKRKAAFMAKI